MPWKVLIFSVTSATYSVIYSENMPSIWTNFNHFEVFQGLFFAFVLQRKDALGTKLLKKNFNLNFVLLYVYLDHQKTKYFSISRKYQCCVMCGENQCRVISEGNVNYSSYCKFSRQYEFVFSSQLYQCLQNSYSKIKYKQKTSKEMLCLVY